MENQEDFDWEALLNFIKRSRMVIRVIDAPLYGAEIDEDAPEMSIEEEIAALKANDLGVNPIGLGM